VENEELKRGGDAEEVSLANVDEYVALCVRFLMHDGIARALKAVRQGLSEVCDLDVLRCMMPDEFEASLCGEPFSSFSSSSSSSSSSSRRAYDFSVTTLKRYTHTKNGYDHDSLTIRMLFKVLSEFSSTEQRQFVRFVTGSPRLPMGGLKNLHPRLSIVRVPCHSKQEPPLPSVMTCTNTLKLPDYTTEAVLKEKLLYCIRECATGFQLS